jgi:GNAT superfamily N-acetyltransferase
VSSVAGPPPLREAVAPDASAIAAVINAAFAVERFFVEGSRTNVDEVRDLMGKGRFLVAEAGGRVTGCVYFEARGDRGYFGLLGVDPAEKGKGLGRLMVAAVEDALRQTGCHAVDIRVVDLRTELVPFYRRLGYEVTGTEPFTAGVPTKQPCHFIRMSKPLPAAGA